MLFCFEKVHYDGMKCPVIFAKMLFLSSLFIVLHFGVNPVVGNKDISVCHKLWNDLGNDMADWRALSLDGDHKTSEQCRRAEKKYFTKRRHSHRKLCFYEGSFPEPYLLAVGKTKIAVVDLTSNYSTFVMNGQNFENLIIDPADDKMYFKTDIGVQRANFDGSEKEIIYQNGKNSIRVFALDWIRRRMYYVDTRLTKSIFVGDMNFTTNTWVHISDQNISSLAVDPNVGYIFYKSERSSVIRINLIGKDRKQFQMKVDDFLAHLDYVNQQLFYSNHESNKIYSTDYDGGFLKNTSVIKIGALAFFGGFLYSQEKKSPVIWEKNVSTGLVYRNISLPRPIFHLKDLVVVEQSLYPTDGCPILPCGINAYCSKNGTLLSCKCYIGYKWSGSQCKTVSGFELKKISKSLVLYLFYNVEESIVFARNSSR